MFVNHLTQNVCRRFIHVDKNFSLIVVHGMEGVAGAGRNLIVRVNEPHYVTDLVVFVLDDSGAIALGCHIDEDRKSVV